MHASLSLPLRGARQAGAPEQPAPLSSSLVGLEVAEAHARLEPRRRRASWRGAAGARARLEPRASVPAHPLTSSSSTQLACSPSRVAVFSAAKSPRSPSTGSGRWPSAHSRRQSSGRKATAVRRYAASDLHRCHRARSIVESFLHLSSSLSSHVARRRSTASRAAACIRLAPNRCAIMQPREI